MEPLRAEDLKNPLNFELMRLVARVNGREYQKVQAKIAGNRPI